MKGVQLKQGTEGTVEQGTGILVATEDKGNS